MDDNIDECLKERDTKVAATKIKIGARLSISAMVQAAIDFTFEHIKKEDASDEKQGVSSADEATAVAVAWGYMARAKGVLGAHLVLSNWEYTGPIYDDGTPKDWEIKDNWTLKGAKMIVIDGKKFKENTWYRCINNKIVEVK